MSEKSLRKGQIMAFCPGNDPAGHTRALVLIWDETQNKDGGPGTR